ncbi:MAG: RodZ domain-containing protein [Candidatus Sulfotelmatobacter sp.]
MGAFGEKLRKQREQRNIALDAISNTTKISTRMLRALEDENFDQLPGGVFNKGFVRAYARQVGLNEEEAISDYLSALRDSQIQSHKILPDFRNSAAPPFEVAAPEPPQPNRHNHESDRVRKTDFPNNAPRDSAWRGTALRKNPPQDQALSGKDSGNDRVRQSDRRKQNRRNDDRRDNNEVPRQPVYSSMPIFTSGAPGEIQPDSAGKPSARIPWGTLAAALLLISAMLAFWNFRRQSHLSAASPSAAASSQTTPAVAAPPIATSYQPSSANGSPKTRQTSPAAYPATTAHTSSLPAATSPSSKPTATTDSSTAGGAATPPAAKAALHVPVAKPPATFTLLIRAEKTTWVSIVADGKPVAEETLIAPAHTSVRATRDIVVKAGNARGISFLLNDKEIPSEGSDGEVRTYIFDGSGMKISAAQTPTTERQP